MKYQLFSVVPNEETNKMISSLCILREGWGIGASWTQIHFESVRTKKWSSPKNAFVRNRKELFLHGTNDTQAAKSRAALPHSVRKCNRWSSAAKCNLTARTNGWGLDPILLPNLQKNAAKCQEGWGYSREQICSYPLFLSHISPFWNKMGQTPRLSGLTPVWFRSSKLWYCCVTVQSLFQHFVRFYHCPSIRHAWKPIFLHFSLKC